MPCSSMWILPSQLVAFVTTGKTPSYNPTSTLGILAAEDCHAMDSSYLCVDCRTRRYCSIESPKLWPARHRDRNPSSRSADRTKSATRTATTYRQTPTARAGSTGVERTDRCRATVAESRGGMCHASSEDT